MTDEMKDIKEKEDKNKISLLIITSDGNYEGEFNVHQKLRHVAEKTIQELNLIINFSDYFFYLQSSTTEFNMDASIEEAVGPVDSACLDYRKKNQGGGNLRMLGA